MCERVNMIVSHLRIFELFSAQFRLLTTMKNKTFENIVGKGENAGNQHYLLFPQFLIPYKRQSKTFERHLLCRCKCFKIDKVHKLVVW